MRVSFFAFSVLKLRFVCSHPERRRKRRAWAATSTAPTSSRSRWALFFTSNVCAQTFFLFFFCAFFSLYGTQGVLRFVCSRPERRRRRKRRAWAATTTAPCSLTLTTTTKTPTGCWWVYLSLSYDAWWGLPEIDRNRPLCFLTPSLPRVINLKFPLQPHEKYYVTQYGELGFS